ncbi:hypothetical protein Btru_062223 [Bulinus truncatus]|nr:hypothetical protein Btru_062223 [Bulinus truncatus]
MLVGMYHILVTLCRGPTSKLVVYNPYFLIMTIATAGIDESPRSIYRTMFSRVHFLLFALALPAICSCASLGDKFETSGEDKTSQGTKRDSNNLFDRGSHLGERYQPWNDWLNKRGLSFSDNERLGALDRNSLQDWSDWMAKRTGGSPMMDDQWGGWDASRYPQGFTGNQFQRWDEFAKRNYPFMPVSGLSRTNNFQSWQDWMKRGGYGDMGTFNGYGGYGNNDLLMSWEDLSRLNKRYQWFGLQPYSSFRRPFSYGLQDWRSQYGLKRSTEEKEEKEEN